MKESDDWVIKIIYFDKSIIGKDKGTQKHQSLTPFLRVLGKSSNQSFLFSKSFKFNICNINVYLTSPKKIKNK